MYKLNLLSSLFPSSAPSLHARPRQRRLAIFKLPTASWRHTHAACRLIDTCAEVIRIWPRGVVFPDMFVRTYVTVSSSSDHYQYQHHAKTLKYHLLLGTSHRGNYPARPCNHQPKMKELQLTATYVHMHA
jgi:hypothetical protein